MVVPDYSTFICERLGCEFKAGLYYHLQIATKGPLEYIALVRSIHYSGDCSAGPTHLIVTLYSPLASEPLFRQTSLPAAAGPDPAPTELLLHCCTHEFMGSRLDAHSIQVSDIATAHALPESTQVAHCVQPPAG